MEESQQSIQTPQDILRMIGILYYPHDPILANYYIQLAFWMDNSCTPRDTANSTNKCEANYL
jgi:hypothetical protein